MRRTIALTLVLLVTVAAFPGCTDGNAAAGVSLDTLPGGTVSVRNTGDGAWGSDDSWTAEEIVRVGGADADTNSEFGRVAAIEFDDAGRIYVADAQARSILVFDSTGHLIRRLGRSGQGPGEFSLVNGMIWGPDGHLWAVDPQNGRYTVYDTAGRYVDAHPRTVGGYAFNSDARFDASGRLVEQSLRGEADHIVRHRVDAIGDDREPRIPVVNPGTTQTPIDSAVVAIDSFPRPEVPGAVQTAYRIEYERGSSVFGIPFGPQLTWRFDGREGVWIGFSDAYRLYHRTLAGDTVRIVERDFVPQPVTAAERDSVERAFSRRRHDPRMGAVKSPPLDLSLIPSTKPVFHSFAVDADGYIWVARPHPRIPDGPPVATFDVFDPDGRFLGSLDLSIGMYPPPVVRGSRLLGVSADSLGAQTVVMYRLIGR